DPELQLAWKWKEEAKPNTTWASRYNNYFEKAILFLDYCKQQSELELQHKEKMQKKRLRRARVIAIFISCIALLAFLLAIYSFDQRNKANKQKLVAINKTQEAEQERKNALAQQKVAEENATEADKQKKAAEENAAEALKQKAEADKQRKTAEVNAEEASKQKINAEKQAQEADKQRKTAEENAAEANKQKKKAETEKIEADKQRKTAEEQRKISNRLKELADARNLANLSMFKFRAGNKTESKSLAIQAFELNKENNGPKQVGEIYAALHSNWTDAINHKNQASYHTYPVKCITGKPEGNIVFTADESGVIYTAKADDGIVKPLGNSINIKEDVRAMLVTQDASKLIVATASSKGFIFEISKNNTLSKQAEFSFLGIAKSIASINKNNFIVLSDKEITK
ncbi:MAG: hypothetical protein H3C56_11065, partial [Chitinophagaceae bacterium]|nr:hypothetical protein [Chitinophagaceae bacterium]